MPRFVKNVAVWFMLLTAVMLPVDQAWATSPLQAFTNLMASSGTTMSYNTPGQFNSQARHAFSFGGLDIHIPDDSVQLVSIQPPSFSAGCGGISFQFGGFSFISGAQFSQFIQQAAQGALGYAVLLAIKTLCPQCEAVLSALQKLSAAAQKMATDSCHAGQLAASKIADSLFPGHANPQGAQQQCGVQTTDSGASDNFLNSLAGTACSAVGSMADYLNNLYSQMSPQQKAQSPIGNSTWKALQTLGFLNTEDMEFIMSITGTTIVTADSSSNNLSGQTTGGYKVNPLPSLMTAGQGLNLMMCGPFGATGGTVATADGSYSVPEPGWILNYCQNTIGTDNGQLKKVYICDDGGVTCLHPTPTDPSFLGNDSAVSNEGFLPLVYATLEHGVYEVSNNQPITNDVLALVNSTPFPLYQMMNIAAVYPDVANELMSNGSVIVSGMLARAMLTKVLQEQGSMLGVNTSENNNIEEQGIAKNAQQMRAILSQLDQANQAALNKIQKNMVVEEMLFSNIQQINRQIQTQVMSQGLAGNQAFAVGVFRGAAGALQ